MNISKSEKAVVIIGSGPGGATVSYELTKEYSSSSVRSWAKDMPEDYKNNEWPAFSQMAWLDKGVSGSARIAKDLTVYHVG